MQMRRNYRYNFDEFNDNPSSISQWLQDIVERSFYEGASVAAKQFVMSCATTLIFHGLNWALHQCGILPSWINLNRFVSLRLSFFFFQIECKTIFNN